MLKLHNMYKVYRTDEVETVALNGVNIEINQGDFDVDAVKRDSLHLVRPVHLVHVV